MRENWLPRRVWAAEVKAAVRRGELAGERCSLCGMTVPYDIEPGWGESASAWVDRSGGGLRFRVAHRGCISAR